LPDGRIVLRGWVLTEDSPDTISFRAFCAGRPIALERIRRRLASTDDGNRQMVDILNAVLTDGLPAVEAACAEALGHGVHSADVVLNILARQREPAPPANIMTPAALTLRHAPIADCARYDNLRRTN
jgi:hypothetical protein